jgi:hypothetical protein|tara:strand:- start:272 stop:529 length:258 start_codon:yes stop_codon:yes gene_type:complete
MAKAKKITKEELENLNKVIKTNNNLQMQVGGIEVEKTRLLSAMLQGQNEFQKLQDELKEKYGDVTVNLQTGDLKPREDGQADKKD